MGINKALMSTFDVKTSLIFLRLFRVPHLKSEKKKKHNWND